MKYAGDAVQMYAERHSSIHLLSSATQFSNVFVTIVTYAYRTQQDASIGCHIFVEAHRVGQRVSKSSDAVAIVLINVGGTLRILCYLVGQAV